MQHLKFRIKSEGHAVMTEAENQFPGYAIGRHATTALCTNCTINEKPNTF